MQKHVTEVARPWWRQLLAMLSPSRLDLGKRLDQHYSAEVRMAFFLAQDAESLLRYSHQSGRVLDASKHASRRAQRIRLALEALNHPITEPVRMCERNGHTAWERLRATMSELTRMSEAYLEAGYAVGHEYPETAGLLLQLHQGAAADRQDLVWTLSQLERTGMEASLEKFAVRPSELGVEVKLMRP
jgi:hypothetical protein